MEETGLCKGVKAKINMKSGATPTFRKCPLPYAMEKKVENDLDFSSRRESLHHYSTQTGQLLLFQF